MHAREGKINSVAIAIIWNNKNIFSPKSNELQSIKVLKISKKFP